MTIFFVRVGVSICEESCAFWIGSSYWISRSQRKDDWWDQWHFPYSMEAILTFGYSLGIIQMGRREKGWPRRNVQFWLKVKRKKIESNIYLVHLMSTEAIFDKVSKGLKHAKQLAMLVAVVVVRSKVSKTQTRPDVTPHLLFGSPYPRDRARRDGSVAGRELSMHDGRNWLERAVRSASET